MNVMEELEELQDFAEEAGKLGFAYETAPGTRVLRVGDELVIGRELDGEIVRVSFDEIAEVYASRSGMKVKDGFVEKVLGRSLDVSEIVVRRKVGCGEDISFGCYDGMVDSIIADIESAKAIPSKSAASEESR